MENIPLPDQEHAWQKLKNLLDEDDRKRRFVITVFLRSCLLWGGLSVVVLAAAWLVFEPLKWGQQPTGANTTSGKQPASVSQGKQIIPQHGAPAKTEVQSIPGSPAGGEIETESKKGDVSRTNGIPVTGSNQSIPKQEKTNTTGRDIDHSPAKKSTPGTSIQKSNKGVSNQEIPAIAKQTLETGGRETSQNPAIKIPPAQNDVMPGEIKKDSSLEKKTDTIIVKTTVPFSIKNDSADVKATVDSLAVEPQAKAKKSRRFIYSAGAGIQQQLPFMGQTSVPYNYYGRKNSLSDYIPSVYFRAEKKGKWFVMGEFRFGAPQSLKEFSFSRQTKFDTSSNLLTTTTTRLKKTYYHQLPLSFNYYVKPGWSVGIGGIYSRFYGAVTEREINNLDVHTQTETVTKQITRIQHFTDSFLYKTQLHLMLQTDVQWRRFTVGLRYAKDLQPYIKYTQPDGRINEEKNASFQLILRYRLWKSG